jgi:hypothetical protein
MVFWSADDDDANGPVKGPIRVTVIVFGVAGAVAAVVAEPAAVVADAAAVVAVELLFLLELQAASTISATTTNAVPARARLRCLPCGFVDICLLVDRWTKLSAGLDGGTEGDAAHFTARS